MREKPSSFVLFLSLTLLTQAAFARPSHRIVAAHKTVAMEHRAGGARSKHKGLREARPAVPVQARRHQATAHSATSHVLPLQVSRKSNPIVQILALPDAAVPADAVDIAAEPQIHVHHDRKLHPNTDKSSAPLAGEAGATPAAADGRRVATVDDFMASLPASDTTTGHEAAAISESHPIKLKMIDSAGASATAHKGKTLVVKTPEEKLSAAPSLPAIPFVQPVLFDRRGHLVVPPALKGSHEILVRQNTMADEEGLERVRDDGDLDQMRRDKLLVALPAAPGLWVDDRLPDNRRYCRPWTALFLQAIAKAHYARFHTALQVNSAVRTVEFQERLRYSNGNAAPSEGSTASPHLTGQAVDIAKHGLSLTEIAWLRAYLLPLVQEGKVDVEEEFQQACFHVSVYKKYIPEAAPARVIQGHHPGIGSIATAVR